MPSTNIAPVEDVDIEPLIALARDIWYRHYPDIISVEQIEYMLAQRYSVELIRAQIASGAAWWDKLELDGTLVAFSACEPGSRPAEMKLDKIYVSYALRGQGFGSLLIRNAERRARAAGCTRLLLQVNKNNASAIAAYRRNGFVAEQAAKFDIGNGFYMDDYVMVKELYEMKS
jgi:ribosomal protein S18 acetylase RimI-like enzyme